MFHVRTTSYQTRRSLACLAAVSLASVLTLTPTGLASPLGDPAVPTVPGAKPAGSQGNALIQKSGAAPKGVVKIAAKAAAQQKAAAEAKAAAAKAAAAKKPAKKTVVAPPKKPATKPATKPTTGTTTPAPSSTTDGATSGAQTQAAVAAPAAVKKATVLSQFQPDDFFNESLTGMGVEHVLLLCQNNFDPEAATTAKVNGQKVVAAVKAARGENASGWVMLDYEIPFDAVFDNGTTDPRYNAMVQSMIDAVKYAKAQLPNCKFTYYGVPNVRYWIPGGGWEAAPQWSQIQTMDTRFSVYKSLVAELDWLNPCVYDRYDPSKHSAAEQAALDARERLFRVKVVELCDRLRDAVGKPDMPIIPGVSLVYEGGGSGEIWKPLGTDEFAKDQIKPLLAAGADGVYLWSSLDYQTWLVGLAWVPTPGEAPRANARELLTKLFFGGTAPASWTTPEAKIETRRRVSTFLANYVSIVRSTEATQVASGGGD
jgi:hypothetical protein